jgi:bifunctional non-homologous end joining protein LigD
MAQQAVISPMLATLVTEPFRRKGWVFEEKYDGIRALAYRRGKHVQLVSRNMLDLTEGFPEIVAALKKLPGSHFILDGEIVALDRHGVSRFQLLQQRGTAPDIRPMYAVFDCLQYNGTNLMKRPLAERRRILLSLIPSTTRSSVSFTAVIYRWIGRVSSCTGVGMGRHHRQGRIVGV